MLIEDFLFEYAPLLFGSFATGWGSAYLLLALKKALDIIT